MELSGWKEWLGLGVWWWLMAGCINGRMDDVLHIKTIFYTFFRNV